MESENDKDIDVKKKEGIDINHDDLSDVSDLDDSIGCHTDDEKEQQALEKEKEDAKEAERTEEHKIEETKIEQEVKKVNENVVNE